MLHDQISIFDMFQAQTEEAPKMQAPEAVPVPVMVQASTIMSASKSFRVYGIVRGLTVAPAVWRPSALEVLSMFPVIREYYMPKGLFDRGCSVRLNIHEVGADGAMIDGGQSAAVDIAAAELYDAAESF